MAFSVSVLGNLLLCIIQNYASAIL